MILRRSKRTPVPKVVWKAKSAPSTALEPRITKKAAQPAQKTVLESVAISVLLKAIKLDKNDSSDHFAPIVTAWE
jgi:hypothetical protein